MNYAGRFNSFILKGQNVFDAIKAYHEMDGITHLEFNYPEHFAGYDLEEIKKAMGDLKVNGLAVRWRNDFTNGLVISFLERASVSIRIRYVTAAITRM